MNRAARNVVDRLNHVTSGVWLDLGWLARVVDELAQATPPHSPEVLPAWCRFLDLPAVWERVAGAPNEVLLRALLATAALPVEARGESGVLDAVGASLRSLVTDPRETVRPELGPSLATALRLAVTAAPAAELLALSPSERAVVEPLRRESGVDLPPAAWTNPWTQKAPKRKPLQVPVAELEARVHGSRTPVPDAPVRDAELEREWNGLRYHALYHLRAMGDSLALRLYRAVDFSEVWAGEELAELAVRFGLGGLDATLRAVEAHRGQLGALASVESTQCVPLMVDGLASRQPASSLVARGWLTRFPETAAVGLVPLVLGPAKEAALAVEALKLISRSAPVETARGLERYAPEVREAVVALRDGPPPLPSRRPALPAFVVPAGLPRPITRDGATALHGDELVGFVQLLKVTPLDGAPWVDDAKARFLAPSLSALSRALFELWLMNGAPPKEKWLLQSVAHFGDVELAEELARRAALLAPKGLSARAQEMAEVLGAMRTKESLALLHGLAKKVRSKAFRARAELVFVSAAEKLGLTHEELAERLVPDFGLSPDGVLPVEPSVRLELTGGKPRFLGADGAVVKSLPSTGDEERDAELATLKKKVAGLVKDGVERLERRMVTAATMSLEHFTEVYAMHGVMAGLARQVLWGQWRGGVLARVFVLKSGAPTDVAGAPVQLVAEDPVGVVHPLQLDEGARAAWAKVLRSPFRQLERAVHRFPDTAAAVKALRALEGVTVETARLLALERAGWERGDQVGGGCYVELTKQLSGGRARLTFMPGIYLGEPLMNREQAIDTVQLEAATASAVELSELVEGTRALRAG